MYKKFAAIVVLALAFSLPSLAAVSPKTLDPATISYRSGIQLMQYGRWQKAIAALERAVGLAPNQAVIREALGGAYFDYAVELGFQGGAIPEQESKGSELQGRIEKMWSSAEGALKKAVELEPKTASYHHTLAWFYLAHHSQHIYDAAADVLANDEADASSKPDEQAKPGPSPAPLLARRAIEEFKLAITLAPSVADYRRSLGDAYMELGQDQTASSAPGETAGISQPAEADVAPVADAGSITQSAVTPAASPVVEQYEAALRLNPRFSVLEYLIYRIEDQKSPAAAEEAVPHLFTARSLDPGNSYYGYEVAKELFYAGRNVEALNALRYANLAPRLSVGYSPAYPKRLETGLRALQTGRAFSTIDDFAGLQSLVEYALDAAKQMGQYDIRSALSVTKEVVRMGQRLAMTPDPEIRSAGESFSRDALEVANAMAEWLGDLGEINWVHAMQGRFTGVEEQPHYLMGPPAGQPLTGMPLGQPMMGPPAGQPMLGQ